MHVKLQHSPEHPRTWTRVAFKPIGNLPRNKLEDLHVSRRGVETVESWRNFTTLSLNAEISQAATRFQSLSTAIQASSPIECKQERRNMNHTHETSYSQKDYNFQSYIGYPVQHSSSIHTYTFSNPLYPTNQPPPEEIQNRHPKAQPCRRARGTIGRHNPRPRN